MKQNLLFNQASALGKRLAMVLTMLLIVGVGQAWGAEGDVLKTYDTNSSTFASEYSRKTGDNFVWWGQKGYYGANNATNHGNLKPTAADIPVVKAQSSSATTSTTGLYYLYTSEAVANVGKVEVKFTAKSGSSTVNAYVVSSSTKAASGSATWTKVTLASNSSKAQGANVASVGTYTFTFDATETDAKYYGVVFVTSSYWRAKNLTFKLYEGAPSTPATPYTVTLKDDNSTLTQSSAGATITLPSRDGCDGYEFVGWTKSWSVAQTTWTTTAPTIIPDGSYTPTANESLYPVYTKTTEGANEETKTITLSPPTTTSGYKEGTQTDSEGNTWSYYAAINNQSGTFEFGLNSNALNYNIGSPIFDGKVSSVSFKARNGSSSEARKFLFCSTNTTAQPTTGDLAEVSIPKSQQFTATYTVDLSQSSVSQFYIYAPKALGITAISVTYTTSTSGYTTSYISVPDCATETVICAYHNIR